jgi:hypothetical protein
MLWNAKRLASVEFESPDPAATSSSGLLPTRDGHEDGPRPLRQLGWGRRPKLHGMQGVKPPMDRLEAVGSCPSGPAA